LELVVKMWYGRIQEPESRIQNPEFRIQEPESKCQEPISRIKLVPGDWFSKEN